MKPFWRDALRSVILLTLAILAFVGTKTFVWMPLLLLAVLYFAVDVCGIDRRDFSEDTTREPEPVAYGVLGNYVIDQTSFFGLFIRLGEKSVFVDIKQDRLAESRKLYALFLNEHQGELEVQLGLFLKENPQFAYRSIQCIGLHSEHVEQGEVFWDPEGYTLLKKLIFTP